MRQRAFTIAAVSVMSLGLCAQAQLHAGDIVLRIHSGVVTTAASVDGTSIEAARVFVSAFGAQGVEEITTDPGFNTVPGQFPAGQVFGVTIDGAARRWAGGNFCTVSDESISVIRSASGFVSTPGGPQGTATNPPPPSLALGVTASTTGAVHTHPTYRINPNQPGGSIADGVYLLALRAWVGLPSGGGVGASEPFYLVLGQNASAADTEAARAWLQQRLDSGASGDALTCPPPPACAADFNLSGTVTIDDIFVFLNAWFAGDARTDQNGDGVSIDDIFVFLNRWFAGC
jgi:hypothetical protein